MRRVYIAGPITGHADYNQPAFAAAADQLRAAGLDPVNPHTLHGGRLDLSYADYMRTDLRALIGCDAIHMLDGWQLSRGARVERTVAAACELRFVLADGSPDMDSAP